MKMIYFFSDVRTNGFSIDHKDFWHLNEEAIADLIFNLGLFPF